MVRTAKKSMIQLVSVGHRIVQHVTFSSHSSIHLATSMLLMVRMFFVSFVEENFKNMTKRFLLIVAATAIALIASTTTANCQASKALVKVVEKSVKGIKPHKIPKIEIGMNFITSNTTYTKSGIAVKSLYDDDDDNKQQRPQVVNLKMSNELQKAQQEAEEISAILPKFCKDLTADLPIEELTRIGKNSVIKTISLDTLYGHDNYNMRFNNPCNKFYVSFNNNIKPLARLTLNEQSPKKYNSITSISENSWKNLRLTKNIKHNYINY